MKYVKSPLNYVGGKYKLLPQILPKLPKSKIFVDLFGGGGNVAVNIDSDIVVYNELCPRVCGIIKGIKDGENNLKSLLNIVQKYSLNKENEIGFKELREEYNSSEDKDWKALYMLVCHSFNYQFRFNQTGGYNMPFGKNRSYFGETLQSKFIDFEDRVKSMNLLIYNRDFRELVNSEKVNSDYFFYCDPPYLITTASYNENGGWTEADETDLLNGLDYLNSKGVKFALSNVLCHKGRTNTLLEQWSKKYTVHFLDFNYNNSNYQSKDTDKATIEVLITNY